jgi:DNA-binding transcriptional MerR regulator
MNNKNDRKSRVSVQLDEDYLEIWLPYLKKGSLTLSHLQDMVKAVSHKNIFDWQRQGILSCYRDGSDSSWRRFSMLDAIKFRITATCRDTGLSVDRIKRMLKNISDSDIEALITSKESNAKHILKLPALECAIIASLPTKHMIKMVMLVYNFDKGEVLIGNKIEIIERYFNFIKASKPALLLPLSEYVTEIYSILNKEAENELKRASFKSRNK